MEHMEIPVIGIGAGPSTDGQVLVYTTCSASTTRFKPKFVKRYAELRQTMVDAVTAYAEEVRTAAFPARSTPTASRRRRWSGSRRCSRSGRTLRQPPPQLHWPAMAGLSRLFAPREREFFDLFEEAGAQHRPVRRASSSTCSTAGRTTASSHARS